jgi:hypothetical protein
MEILEISNNFINKYNFTSLPIPDGPMAYWQGAQSASTGECRQVVESSNQVHGRCEAMMKNSMMPLKLRLKTTRLFTEETGHPWLQTPQVVKGGSGLHKWSRNWLVSPIGVTLPSKVPMGGHRVKGKARWARQPRGLG